MWGAEVVVYTETFEDASYTTSTTYNNSTEKKHGPTDYQWGVLCGTPNTGANNGSKAFAMRYYKSVTKTPTLTQYFDINNVDRITFWAKTESTSNKLNVEYSTNGGSSWSSLASNISVTTSYKEYTYNFAAQQNAVRLRFTMGTTTEKKSMFIDDVAFIKVSSGSEPETPEKTATALAWSASNYTATIGETNTFPTLTTDPADLTGVTYSSSNTSVAIINASTGAITLVAAGTTTITASYAGNETFEAATDATYSLSVNAAQGGGGSGDGECVWQLVTDASTLKAEDEVIIAASGDNNYAISTTQANNNRTATSITKNGNKLDNPSSSVQVLILNAGSTTGTWAFYTRNLGYLYAASSSGNQLKTKTTLDVNGSWTISISNGVASIVADGSSNRNVMQFNPNNGSPIFACYASASQTSLALYKKVCTSSAPTTYTVTYNKNGATSGSAPTDENSPYTEKTLVTVLGNTGSLAKTGYTFGGWNTQADGQGISYSAGASFTIAADVTLYAQWKANTYKVSFNANEGTGTMTDQSFTYDEAKKALTTNAFTRTGYTFNGWNTQANGSGTSYADKAQVSNLTTENNATVTLYAQWKINTFTVTFNKNGGTGTMASQTFTYNVAQNLTTNSFSRKGYTFAGWNTQANGNGTVYIDQQSVTLTAAGLTLYAQWTPITYTVIFNPNGGDGIMDNQVFTYDQAQYLTVNTFTRTGYTFNGWNNEDDGSGDSFTDKQEVNNLSSNKDFEYNLYAQWSGIVPIINTHPTSASYFWGESAEALSVEVSTQNVNHNYQWQSSLDNEQWYDIPDETNNSYLPSTETSGTTYYRVVVTNANADNCIATSNVATIIVRTPNCRWVEADITNLETGANVVISMNDPNGTFAMSNTEGTTSAPKAVGVSILNKSLENRPSEDIIWTLEKDNEGKLIFHPKNATSNLYCNAAQNDNDRVRVGTSSNAKINHKFEVDGSFLKNSITLHYIGLYYSNGSAQDWRGYAASSNFANQELKVYASDCLQPDEYWMNYNLSNVICAQPSPLKTKISVEEEGCELEFSANSGYQLPTEISVQMGNRELVLDDEYLWENGYLLILPNVDITGDITINILGCPLLETPVKNDPILTSTSATFSWVSVANAEKYEVTISDNNPSTEDIVRTTTETEITLDGLTKNTTFKWDIKPIAEDFCSNYSQEWVEFTTLDQFTVTFNANGHGTAPATQTLDAGSKATEPEKLSADGYTFNYWYTTDANVPFDFNTPIAGNTTLNAKWTPNVYTITFYKQYGNGGTDNATVTFNSNDYSVATIEAPTRDKYEFSGYYTGQQGAGVQVVDTEGKWLKNVAGYTDANGNWIKAENTHLYAKWTAIYTITWVVNNNTETPYHTSTVLSGSTIDQLPTPPANNLFADCDVNAFVGWSTDNIGFDPDPTAPTDLFKTVAEAQNKIGAISADEKFYAVYASASNGADSYKLATKVEDLFDGQTVIIAKDNGALERDNNTIDKVNISPDGNGNLSNVTDNIKWTLEASDTHWKLNNNGGYLGVTSTANQTAVSVTETNNVWQIAKSTASGDYFYICQPNTTIGLQYYNSRWQIYSNNSVSSSTNFTLKIYVPNVTNFITRCTALPDPVWGGATIDNTVIPVNCGSTTSNSHAAQISFPAANNYNLYKDITVEASSGFVLSTSRDAVEYQTSVTLSPTQSNTNAGTFANKYVYVRAVAPAQSDEDFTGTITISGKQIETQTINVTADVTCTQYTLTFNDQGQTKEVQGFAGTSVEAPAPWVGICTEPIQYVFDGWATAPVANDTEEYEKIDFSAYTMPDNNTTRFYAVYRYAEDGGDPIEGFVKVTESLNDWTGDYVIVNEAAKKAIGNSYANTNTLTAVDVKISDNKVVEPTNKVIWQMRKNGENYTMYNAAASKYAYITGSKSENAGLSDAVQYVNISWGSSPETARVIGSGEYSVRCFSYYTNGNEWRTYAASGNNVTGALYKLSNKPLLYTSSLICGEISVEEDNVVVTSTKDQKVKVTVPIKVTSFYNDAVNVTGAGESTFSVATTENVAVNIDETTNIVLTYTPAEYDKLDNETITLTASNGATTTFQVKGRSLPETFAVVAKVGGVWYALPSQGLNSTTPPAAYPVEVDNIADPTAVTAVPANADWSLRKVYESTGVNDRYTNGGHNLVFVNNVSPEKALNASSTGNYLLTDAQYNGYHNSTYPDLYEWTSTTSDLETYTLTNVNRGVKMSINTSNVFGVHSQNVVTTQVRFLPIQNRYTPMAAQVVEWKENSVVVMYNGDPAQTASVSVNGAAVQTTELSGDRVQKDIAVYELAANDLATNPTQSLSITIGSEKVILPIPYIVSGEKTDLALLPGTTVAARQEVAKVADLVVLKDAKLTADGTKGDPYKFRNVTVYGGGKLVIPSSDKGFGVTSLTLRIGGVTDDGKYDYVYPEFELQGTFSNTSAVINLDYVTTKEQYYTFVAPFAVETKDIKYPVDIYGSNVEAANRGSFEFQYYDGAARAAGEKGWKVVEEDATNGATLTAHKGYTFYGMPKKVSVNGGTSTRQKFGIHRIPMSVTAANVMTHENTDQTTMVSAYPSQHNINAGWNLIGNPYMSTISGLDNTSIQTGTIVLVDDRWQWSDAGSQASRFIVFPSNDGEWYYTSQASNATLPAFKNFFVQIANESADALSIPRNTPAAQAPARRAAQEAEEDIELAIVLEQDAAHADQLDFLVNDAYTAVYDYNADFTKMMNNTQLNLFGLLMEDNLSFVAVDHLTAKTDLAIGYQVPQAGEYTLRLSEKPYVMWSRVDALYVTDHEVYPEVTTNLLEDDYTFQVGNAETNITRFTISIIPSKESSGTTTGVDNLLHHDMQPQKFIYNDQLYILREGVVYDAMGQRIMTINK